MTQDTTKSTMNPTLPLKKPDGEPVRCWVVTNGMAGFEVQGRGVAEALGLEPEIKRIGPPPPWSWMAPWGPSAPDPAITPPWPDLVIASGRQAIPYARLIKRRSAKDPNGGSFVAILQDPRISPEKFDFVWAPAHDQLKGPNVLSTLTSPNRLTPARLAAAAERIAPRIAALPHPRIAVLIGGANKVYEFTEPAMIRLATQLAALTGPQKTDRPGASLMITTSRRTGAAQERALRQMLQGHPALIWSPETGYDSQSDPSNPAGDNPYFDFLGQAEAILVTCDSANMVGEAAATGKPVHIIELEGGSAKFHRFLDSMYAAGVARPFVGLLESWEYAPLNATQDIAHAIARAMNNRWKTR